MDHDKAQTQARPHSAPEESKDFKDSARAYFFNTQKWNFGAFAKFCYSLPTFPHALQHIRLSIARQHWELFLEEFFTSSDRLFRDKAASLIAASKRKKQTTVKNQQISDNYIVINSSDHSVNVNHSNLNASPFERHSAGPIVAEPTDPGENNQDTAVKETSLPTGGEELPAYCEQTPSFSAFVNLSGDDDLPSTAILSPASLRHVSTSQGAGSVGSKRKAPSESDQLPKSQKVRVNPAAADFPSRCFSHVSDPGPALHRQSASVPIASCSPSPSSPYTFQVPDATAGTISPEPGVLLLSQFIHRMVSTLNQVEKEREVILSRVDQLHHEVTSLGRGLTEQMDALNAKVEDLINQRFPDS